jgi:hypothetical protein
MATKTDVDKITEIWAGSGKIIERDLTLEEAAQRKADKKTQRERQAEDHRQAETRAAAIEHAKTLGFTDAMLTVMYPNLTASE